jgi:hypothetical protein
LLVEAEPTGEVVSTTCLIPWRCAYEEITLDVAMLEMVATHPTYRQRGLVRAQIERFHQVVRERQFDLSIIEGIPSYYRQFGYAYATDHWAGDTLPVGRIPPLRAGEPPPYRLRPATLNDIPVLTGLYTANLAALHLSTLRDGDYWRYLLGAAHYPVRMVEERDAGRVVGYICTLPSDHGRGVRIVESSLAEAAVGLDILQQLRMEASGELWLGWPSTNLLVQLGRSLGSMPTPSDQWLVRITDVVAFLTKVGPVLEHRLAMADGGDLATRLRINLFRQAYELEFVAGKLRQVAAIGFVDASMGADGGDLCIPPHAFVRLVLGYRNLAELADAWPDIVVKRECRYLIEALFPQRTGYLWMPYLYYGSS